MKKIFNKLFALLSAVIMLGGLAAPLSVTAAGTVSGVCGAEGSELIWTLDTETGKLTISGTGAMEDYPRNPYSPWYNYSSCIKTVFIGDGATKIGERAFYGCDQLTEATIGNGVTVIGGGAFFNCVKLSVITIGNSVKNIDEGAFYGCESLTKINIPDSVTSIGYSVFRDCKNLTELTLGSGVADISNRAFEGCSALTKVSYTGTLAQWCGIAFGEYETNPLCYAHALYIGGQLLTEATIPSSVTIIGNNAFHGCTGLKKVNFSGSVTSLGNNAFHGCTGLTEITIPDSVTNIGDAAFCGCKNLVTVTIPNSVAGIGAEAFSDCSALANLTVPDSVTVIGYNAFFNIRNIIYFGDAEGSPWGAKNTNKYAEGLFIFDSPCKTELISCDVTATGKVTVPDSVTAIGKNAFYACTGITGVILPDSVADIGDYAFRGCGSLVDLTIPDKVTSIGDCAFYECAELTSITLGIGVTHLGKGAFENCVKLSNLTLPDKLTTIGNAAFAGCTSLKELTIPDNVIYIDNGAFMLCSGLKKVTTGNGVITINDGTFYGCEALTDVVIGNSVTNIGEGAFYNCTSLANVFYTRSEDEWKEINISYGNEDLTSADIHYNWVPPHEHRYTVIEALPTCTERGYTTYVCACGDSYVSNYTDALGHDYDTVVTREATLTAEGEITHTCSRCGDSYTESIAKLPQPSVAIRNFTANITVDFKATVTFTADIKNALEGANAHWFVDSKDTAVTGDTFTLTRVKRSFTVQVKYIKDGKVLAESWIETVNVKTGFFARLTAFFRSIFGKLPKVVQVFPELYIVEKTGK